MADSCLWKICCLSVDGQHKYGGLQLLKFSGGPDPSHEI